MMFEFFKRFFENIQITISYKTFQWKMSCSMRTDMTKLIATFRNFANVPKSQILLTSKHIHLLYKNQLLIFVYRINPCSEMHTNTDIPTRVRM
jgi:hypothetical protein